MTAAVLADVTPAWRDAVHGAQQSFRVLLDAMSRPGRVLVLPDAALAGIVPPPSQEPGAPMSLGAAALLLTLLDAETTVSLGPSLAGDAAMAYLRFHTGVREALPGEPAAFHVLRAADAGTRTWGQLDAGSDEAPQRGATLVVEVPALHEVKPQPRPAAAGTVRLHLRGPGIESVHHLAVGGLPLAFWRERIALQALFPRGVDLVLVCGTQIAAIPRSTRITLEI